MELIFIGLIFVVLWGAMVYLSSTEILQGWKTRISVALTAILSVMNQQAPEVVSTLGLSEAGVAWVIVGLAVSALLGVQLRRI